MDDLRHDCCDMAVYLCKWHGLGYSGTSMGRTWNIHYVVNWTPSVLRGRTLQRTAGIWTLRYPGRERAVSPHTT